MAAKRAKRETRFTTLRDLFGMVGAGYSDLENAGKQVGYSNLVIFKSELEKFHEAYPDVDMTAFQSFIEATGAFKIAGRKGTGSTPSKLESDEKIAQLQIAPENVEKYKSLLSTMQDARKELEGVIGNKEFRCNISITNHGKKSKTP